MTRSPTSLSWLTFLSLAAAALLAGCGDGGGAQVVPGDAVDSAETTGDAGSADTTAEVGPDGADTRETTWEVDPTQDVADADAAGLSDPGDTPDPGDASDAGDAADTTADVGLAALTISEEAMSIGCALLCADIATECATLADLGDDTQGCELLCYERLSDDALWAANYGCQRSACDLSLCFATAAPLPEVAGCRTFCQKAAACGEFAATGAPDGELGLCTAYCSGRSAMTPGGPAIVGCTSAALSAGTCGIESLRAACKLPAQGCDTLCGRFYTASGPDACFGGAPLFTTWPTVDQCVSACAALPDGTRAQFFGCVAATDCEDPSPCLASSPTVQPACTSACEAGFALCKGTYGGLATASFCAAACSGAFKVLGIEPGNADAAACITDMGLCPALDVDKRGSVVGLASCAAAISATCDAVCAPFDKCATSPSDRLGCVQGCTALEATEPARVQQIAQCVQNAAGDCTALDSCVPE